MNNFYPGSVDPGRSKLEPFEVSELLLFLVPAFNNLNFPGRIPVKFFNFSLICHKVFHCSNFRWTLEIVVRYTVYGIIPAYRIAVREN